MSDLSYSYHTFLYPFAYDKGKFTSYLAENDNQLKEIGCWEPIPFHTVLKKNINSGEYDETDRLNYNIYQYFYPKVRKSLFNMQEKNSDSTSVHYQYKATPDNQGLIGKYKIAYEKNYKPENLEVDVNNISLSLYPKTGIGVLVLELEYRPEENVDRETRMSNVRILNDLGRRIFSPSVGVDKSKNLTSSFITANHIRLDVQGKPIVDLSYPNLNKDGNFHFEQDENIAYIDSVLGESMKEQLGLITSILDDRMFVGCLVRDEELSTLPVVQMMSDAPYTSELRSKADEVYKFLYLDGNSCSCKSERMMKEKFREHLYDRWAASSESTFHGASEYSFVCAAGEYEGIKNSVIYPFLTQYMDMAKLALVQRAEIVELEREVSAMNFSTAELKQEDINHIRNIWKEYVYFQNELYLPEVTFQEQGVEIYSILKKSLKIDELMKRLDEELANLRDFASMENARQESISDATTNRALNLLTVVGFTIGLYCAGQDFMSFFLSQFFNLKDDITLNYQQVSGIFGAGFLLLGILSAILSYFMNHAVDDSENKGFIAGVKELWNSIGRSKLVICIWILISVLVIGMFVLAPMCF